MRTLLADNSVATKSINFGLITLPSNEMLGIHVDGHKKTHSLHAAQLAIANKLDIISVHSHSTHLVQPLDVGVLGPLKCFLQLLDL